MNQNEMHSDTYNKDSRARQQDYTTLHFEIEPNASPENLQKTWFPGRTKALASLESTTVNVTFLVSKESSKPYSFANFLAFCGIGTRETV